MMAKKPASKSNKRAPRKSTTRRAKVAKRKAYFTYVFMTFLVMGFLVGFGYYLGQKSVAQQSQPQAETLSQIFQEVTPTQAYDVKYDEAGFGLEGMIEKLHQNKAKKEKQKQQNTTTTILKKGKKPKLVIIIDDVSQSWQIKAIKALRYHITPSIFPPSKQAERSHLLATQLKHFMVHLPMQSGNAQMNRMRGTLKTTDSPKKMQARAKEIRKLFPKAKFLNNHTGSRFTSNYKAMKRMYGYLKAEGFVFVDSRTSGKTKVRKITKEHGDRYIVRDVFIDNTQTISYIHKQLSKAVKIAKKRGYAIAIGHPHKATFKALSSAKDLLKGVNVVYIDELYQ
jgi:polysaccharide deacetylase 2 family uncharacterized protein YibQ